MSDFCPIIISGSPALTSRGLKEGDFEQVITFLHRAIQIAGDANKKRILHLIVLCD